MTDSEPDAGAQGLDPRELGAYFVLTEAVSLLQHQTGGIRLRFRPGTNTWPIAALPQGR